MYPIFRHTHTHTCSEQSLRILMWNVSYVQKHSNKTWQELVDDQRRENSKWFSPNRLRKPYRQWSDIEWKTESLGFVWHPGWSAPASTIMHSFVGMRLHDGRMLPAVCYLVQTKQEIFPEKDVLHLFRWFTHTHTHSSKAPPATRHCGWQRSQVRCASSGRTHPATACSLP